jgi:Flp pilus assembly protein TadG
MSRTVGVPHGRAHRSDGQGLVEFALVFPILMLLLFGLVDVGRLVYINNALAEGAREGARYGSVAGHANVVNGIQNYTTGMMAAVPGPSVTVTCTWANSGQPASPCGPNNILTVTVSATVTMLTPGIGSLIGPRTLSATSVAVVN